MLSSKRISSKFYLLRRRYKDKKIVYCSGTFDLIHPGHTLFLEACKKYGDILVVGVGSDFNIKKNKGKSPIMNQCMRLRMVDSLKYVDFSFISINKPIHHPLEFLQFVFKSLQPDFYIINNDASDIPYRKLVANKYHVPLIILKRNCPPKFKNISTTKLIEKIKYVI